MQLSTVSFVIGGDICLLIGVFCIWFCFPCPYRFCWHCTYELTGRQGSCSSSHRVHSIVREIKGDCLLPLGEVQKDAKIETVTSRAFVIDFDKSMTVHKEGQ